MGRNRAAGRRSCRALEVSEIHLRAELHILLSRLVAALQCDGTHHEQDVSLRPFNTTYLRRESRHCINKPQPLGILARPCNSAKYMIVGKHRKRFFRPPVPAPLKLIYQVSKLCDPKLYDSESPSSPHTSFEPAQQQARAPKLKRHHPAEVL